MTKTYTTEEIVRRLKAWESITAINECEMRHNEGKALKIGKTYKINKLFINCDIEIKSELYNVHIFDVDSFSEYFMFTSDYEAMKSEDVVKPDTLKDESPMPEWLQRERVRFWSRCFSSYQSTHEKKAEYANKDLEQFDKRFLTQKETK